jgi:ABC-2 type transport system ATP-binding protein
VTRKYGSITALRGVALDVRAGELLAVPGPNGAGKTTAVRLLLGLQRLDVGLVRVFGRDPRQAAARTRVGAMLQVAKVLETLRVREHIDLFRSYYPRPLSRRAALEAAGLEGLEARLFGALSGGERQRVLFALALCGDPALFLLDEPTMGMDVATRRSIWERIRARMQSGCTVVLTAHYLEEADALADRVVVEEGRTEIRTAPPETLVRELLALDPGLQGLEVTSCSLEDAFLSIVQNDNDRPVQEAVA